MRGNGLTSLGRFARSVSSPSRTSRGTGSGSRLAIGAATLSLLAAVEPPVLCLIDDAHWLDSASADALLFAARRVEAEGVVMMFAARDSEHLRFESRGLTEITLSGLPPDSAHELLARSVHMAPQVVARLISATSGNPLALIEIPSALTLAQRSGSEALDEPLPTGLRVEQAFLSRARRVSPSAYHLLLVAAASDTVDLDFILTAAKATGHDLEELEAAGLVQVRGHEFVFRHPLVRSAVYSAAADQQRRGAHQALANAA
jgi:hypothetical protein